MTGFQTFILGAALLAIVVALAQPPGRPAPNFLWGTLGVMLLIVAFVPSLMLLVILGVALSIMFGGFRRQY